MLLFQKVDGTSLYDFACVFWDYDLNDWSTAGCSKGNTSQGFLRCFCNHTTNFAALWVMINSAAHMFSNEDCANGPFNKLITINPNHLDSLTTLYNRGDINRES